jgi:hypothetical protein
MGHEHDGIVFAGYGPSLWCLVRHSEVFYLIMYCGRNHVFVNVDVRAGIFTVLGTNR